MLNVADVTRDEEEVGVVIGRYMRIAIHEKDMAQG